MKNNSSITRLAQQRVYLRRCLLLLIVILASVLAFENLRTVNAAPGPVTGSVWHDVNGNGIKDAGEGTFSNVAIVNVYNSSGGYIKSRTSDNSGNFSLSGLNAGTYYVSVFNTTRPALLTGPPGLINDVNVQVEQTYGSVGAGAGSGSGPVCVSAAPNYTARANYTSTPGEWTVGTQNGTNSGPCFGGRKADMTNTVTAPTLPLTYSQNQDVTTTNPALNTQKTVSKVVVTNDGGVSNVDFGLSASVVTNTSASGQGSLSQFITNANAIGGARAMRFVPSVITNQGGGSNAWWQINQGNSPLPTITNNSTVLDGRAWNNIDGSTQLNTNTGTLGGATVGTTQYVISGIQKPELELIGNTRASGLTPLLQVTGNSVSIAHFGLNSTTNYPSTESSFIQQTGGSGITVNDNVMGVNIASGSNYSTRPQSALSTAFLLSLNNAGTYRHNYMSSNDGRGMSLNNVNSLLLSDWIIEENDGPSAGVSFGTATTRIMVRHNNMPTAWLDASLLITSLGLHTLTENTISGGGGVVTIASLQNTITKNVITNATGSNPGISVGGLSTGNYISQNSFSGNGGNAIDLNADGVSANTLGCLTQVNGLINLANTGIARPSITNARLNGTTLTFDVSYCVLGVFNVEVYKTAAGNGDSNAGEGVAYLGTLTNLNLINGSLANQSLTVSGVNPGDSISAIVVDAVLGNTSEFGPNATALSPPSTPSSAPDMTNGTDSGVSNTDNITNDATPTFTGSCSNGETVTLYVDGQAITLTQLCSGGSYSITPSVDIAEGAHTVAATFANGSGESAAGPSLSFAIDTTTPSTPDAPDLIAGTDSGTSTTDNITNVATPTFTGSCINGETITLYADGALSASQVCSGSSYSLQPSSPLAQGVHSLTVTSTDVAGNQSSQSTSLNVTVDTNAPNAPVISSPANGSAGNNSMPTISGSGETGAVVTVRNSSNVVVCTAIVVSSSWSCTPSSALPEGSISLTATQTDVVGNTSPSSNTVTIAIDTTPPGAPVISSPASDSVTNDSTPTITGTAAANASVSVTISGQSPVTVTADGSGNWTYTPSSGLPDAGYTVNATQSDAAGNVSPVSNTVSPTIDTIRPSVTINKADDQADPTTDSSARFTVLFSEPIASGSFGPSDISIGSSPPTSEPQVTNLTQINSTTWQITITSIPNHTTVSANLSVNAVTDPAGNDNTASTSTDNSVLYEVNSPNITKQITNDTTPSLDGECVTNHNLQLDLQGPATRTSTTSCSNNQWTFTVPTGLPDGTYNVIVTDTTVGSLTNTSTNQTAALIIDTVRPGVTVSRSAGQASPTNVNSASFTVTFSENIDPASFTASDLNLTSTSTGQLNLTQQSATVWQAVITSMTSGDTVTLALPSNRVADLAGNLNTNSVNTNNSVSYDATPPAAPVITAPNDSTTTNDSTPIISGSGENGVAVTVLVDDAAITCQEGTVTVSGGNWSCTPTIALSEGEHELTARQTDPAGNQSTLSNTVTLTVDSMPPAQLSMPDLTSGSDTGASNTDNITSDTTPTFTGTCNTGDTIRLFSDSTLIATSNCTGSIYSLTANPALDQSQHTITATATDEANNTSTVSPALTITIDANAPHAPTINSPADNSLVNIDTPIISGNGEDGVTIVVRIDGNSISCQEGAILVVNNGWSCTPSVALSEGEHIITARQIDAAGNMSAVGTAHTITIDTVAPNTLNAPDLASSSDTGASNNDNITGDRTPTLLGNCEDGDTITLLVDGQNMQPPMTVLCSNDNYNFTFSSNLPGGNYDFSVTATDAANNTSTVSSNLTVSIVTSGPAAPEAPDLDASSDSGFLDSDNLTNYNTPSFHGSCHGAPNATLYIDGLVVASGSCFDDSYELADTVPLSDGEHHATVSLTDSTGIEGNQSVTLLITVDVTAPAIPDLTSHQDGHSGNDPTPTLGGEHEEDGTHIQVPIDGNEVDCEESDRVLTTNGTWQCTIADPLPDGEHEVAPHATDPAGNQSEPSEPVNLNVDTTPPGTLTIPDLLAADDSGASNTDNVTQVTAPRFSGSCINGDTIQLYINGTLSTSTICSNSMYQLSVTTVLSNGSHAITVVAIDPAGNSSTASPALNIIIDTVTPPILSTPDLTTDSGNNATDNITNDTTPSFSDTCEDGNTVQLFVGVSPNIVGECINGNYSLTISPPLSSGNYAITVIQIDSAGNQSNSSSALPVIIDNTAPAAPLITAPTHDSTTSQNQVIITGQGENGAIMAVLIDDTLINCSEGYVVITNDSWRCTLDTPLSDGEYTITAYQTDVASNQSSDSAPITVTIDTSPPAAPGTPDLSAGSDSGVSSTDNLTNNTTPTFRGTCVDDTLITLYANSSVIASSACESGNYSLTASLALAAGTYNVTATATNQSNVTGPATPALSVTIETNGPAVPSTPDLTATTDSGRSNSDNITNNQQGHFSGSCTNGTSLELRANDSIIAQGSCNSDSYELIPNNPLSDGNLLITVTAISLAGNSSLASNSLAVVIDATSPAQPVVSVPYSGMQTNNNRPTMSGMGETQAWLHIWASGNPITCSQASPLEVTGGVWTCTSATNLVDGQWNVYATQTDVAGNTSTQTMPVTMTVDTTPPVRLGRPDLTAVSDSGSSNSDNLTNITIPVLVGVCVNGDTVKLRQNSIVIAQVVCSSGSYSLSPTTALVDGIYGFSATATDLAGNTSSVSLSLNVTIRTAAVQPAMPGLHSDSDSGVSDNDGVTRITLPTLTGPCTADETVRVYIDGSLHRTVVCASPFLAQPLNHLAQGNHTVTISVTDLAGNISGMSPAYTFTIDTVAPGNPTVSTPASGSTPTVTNTSYATAGMGEANAWINIWEGGISKCTATIDSSGNWSCTLTNLTNGNHNYTFSVTDRAGNPGAQIITRTIFVNHP